MHGLLGYSTNVKKKFVMTDRQIFDTGVQGIYFVSWFKFASILLALLARG